jgi:hypothetical protein
VGFKSRPAARETGVKTLENNAGVPKYMASIPDPARREECKLVLQMMREVSGLQPKMWGSSIVGFGSYHYKYASGREGDWMRIGFSARKKSLTIYSMAGFDKMGALLKRLGPAKHSVSCLYLAKLDEVDIGVLRELIELFWNEMSARYPSS